MESTATSTPPRSYRIVAIVALVWMLIGVALWFTGLSHDDAALASMTEGQQQFVENYPLWLRWVYGIAVFAGLLGAAGLLLRKGWAVPALLVSVVCVLVQFLGGLATNAVALAGVVSAVVIPIVVLAIGAAIWWYADKARKRGWMGA